MNMAKKRSEYPEQIVVRLTTQQRVFIDEISDLHKVRASDVVRAFVEHARVNHAVHSAIATIDKVLTPIEEAGAHANH
jgi:hypothetical protein